MEQLKDIIPPERLVEYRKEVDRLKGQLLRLRGTWIERNNLLSRLVMAHYEKKFLKAVNRLTNG